MPDTDVASDAFLIRPDWPAPTRVRAVSTTRQGGASEGVYDSMNLADHVGDSPACVAENRQRLVRVLDLPAEPCWLRQVHGERILNAARPGTDRGADASYAAQAGSVCVVLTADCLPVLFCTADGSRVAAAHAGWRGLAGGVLEATVEALEAPPEALLAWLGPAIGPQAFVVGGEVRAAFVAADAAAVQAFTPCPDGKFMADLYRLARQRLAAVGVERVYGGGACTYTEASRFFSYRREARTGRMASLIWLESR